MLRGMVVFCVDGGVPKRGIGSSIVDDRIGVTLSLLAKIDDFAFIRFRDG